MFLGVHAVLVCCMHVTCKAEAAGCQRESAYLLATYHSTSARSLHTTCSPWVVSNCLMPNLETCELESAAVVHTGVSTRRAHVCACE